MYIKHETTMDILLIIIIVIVMDIRFLGTIIANISMLQMAFQSLSNSKYLQFFNSKNF